MTDYDELKEKVIIIAENDKPLAEKIKFFFEEQGYVNIKMAKNGNEVYGILRPYYFDQDQVGLVIIDEQLAECDVTEMRITLSTKDDGLAIPFIILSDNKFKPDAHFKSNDIHNKLYNYKIDKPINYSELLTVVDFQLMMKHERFLRYQQEELLINELAERKVVDAKLKYLVVHDELTSLLNRQNFERQFRLIINQGNMFQQKGALLFFDIDHFSLINEIEGFEIGDRLLVDIVSIIRKQVSGRDLFARIGADEFCLFLANKTVKEAKVIAEKVRAEAYEYKFFAGDVFYNTSISIGISDLQTTTLIYHPSEMISHARQACKLAKENGRNIVWEYNDRDNKIQEKHRDVFWVPLIRKALLEEGFFLVFQPIVDLKSEKISHYEALIRMKGPENETISPIDFIPVAERMGLIHKIDLWVVEQAIDFLAALPSYMSDVSLAINLSSVAFQDTLLLPTIKEKLALSWVDAKRITFEITETAAVDNYEQTRNLITKIRALGCKFSLDDFGAGFCSFNYLKSFPVDYVKIDGQFIRNLVNDETDQVLVKSMADIAKSLGKKTIAEFVETPETIVKLQEVGIDLAQGYVFGKPKTCILYETSISFSRLLEPLEGDVKNDLVNF